MHDPVVMHFLQAEGHSLDELLDLFRGKHGLFLIDAVVELSVGKELEDDVDGVIGFEDSFTFDDVFAVESAKHLDFVQQV
jgi:hypothetical protein